MFAANQSPRGERKDTVENVERTGVFCWNLATWDLREHVNASAEWLPPGVDEFAKAGLDKAWSRVVRVRKAAAAGRQPQQQQQQQHGSDANGVGHGADSDAAAAAAVEEDERGLKVPLVARSPVRFECEYYSTLRLPGNPPMGAVDVIIGKVVGIHIDEAVITDGRVDVRKTQPIARCGYYQYAVVRETFDMIIPGEDSAMLGGLEGSSKINKSFRELGTDKERDKASSKEPV
jgi:flavin reductase (DIM6/NTAB) family NADH-FMN oxidoreductase RutF